MRDDAPAAKIKILTGFCMLAPISPDWVACATVYAALGAGKGKTPTLLRKRMLSCPKAAPNLRGLIHIVRKLTIVFCCVLPLWL